MRGGIAVAFARVLQLAEDLVDDRTFLIGEGCSISDEEPHGKMIIGLDGSCQSACVRARAILEEIPDAGGLDM